MRSLLIARSLIALIFCLFCSCAYIEEYIGISAPAEIQTINGTTSSSLKSPADKINASGDQSKHLENSRGNTGRQSVQSSEITKNSLLLNPRDLKPFKSPNAEILEIYPFYNSGPKSRFDIISVNDRGDVLLWEARDSFKNSYKVLNIKPGFISVTLTKFHDLLAAAYSGQIEIYDLSSGEKVYSISRVNSRVSFMEFSPAGDSLLMAGVDGVVYRWQFQLEKSADTIIGAEKSLERYIGHSAVVNLVRFHPYGRVFVSADWGGSINAWLLYNEDKYKGDFDENIFAGRSFTEEVNRARGSRKVTSIIDQLKFSEDGQFFYVASEEGAIEIWSVRGFKESFSIGAHKGKIYDFSLNSSLNRLISISRDGKLKIWQVVVKESKLPGVKEYELQGLKEIALKDINLTEARRIIYLDSENALVANRDGSLRIVDVKI